MFRFLLFAALLVVPLLADDNGSKLRRRRYYTWNGERCYIGVGELFVPPGEERPLGCPPFVDSDGICWIGDMGLPESSCDKYKGQYEVIEHPDEP